MEELTIGDKVYISSKQAAKITGYAKDYVGQLCREGRVEARLVGRNWYVLESSIREHRFGKEVAPVPVEASELPKEVTSTWEAPRYSQEAEEPVLPPLSVRETASPESAPVQVISDMQEAWKEWHETRSRTVPETEPKPVREPVGEEAPEENERSFSEPEPSDIPNIYKVSAEYESEVFEVMETEEAVPRKAEKEEPAAALEREREERRVATSAPLNLRSEIGARRPIIPSMERVQSSASVIDLSAHAYDQEGQISESGRKVRKPRKGGAERERSGVRTPVTVNAGLIAIAGIAATVALVGSGIVDAGLAGVGAGGIQEGIINLVQGESVYIKPSK